MTDQGPAEQPEPEFIRAWQGDGTYWEWDTQYRAYFHSETGNRVTDPADIPVPLFPCEPLDL